MKKRMKWAAIPALALAIMVPGMASAADMDTGMTAKVDYSHVTVMKKDGHELVPLRQIAMSLGYSVDWTKESVMLTKNGMMSMGMGMGKSDMKDMTDMTDMKDMKDMKDMDMKSDGMTDMSDMKPMPYTVILMPGSKNVTVGAEAKTADYAPIVIMGKTYVSKPFVEMFLAMM